MKLEDRRFSSDTILEWPSFFVGYRTDKIKEAVFVSDGRAFNWDRSMAQKRKRIKHKTTFEERLAEQANKFKKAAEKQPPGSTDRELLLQRARQAEMAVHLNDWLRHHQLHPPK